MNIGICGSFSVLVSSGYMPSSVIAGSYGGFIPSFFKESPYHLPQWLYQFTFPPTVQEGSLFSTPFPGFIVCKLFDDGHSNQCEVISHCSFDLRSLVMSDIPLCICTMISVSIHLLMNIQVASMSYYWKKCCNEQWGICISLT